MTKTSIAWKLNKLTITIILSIAASICFDRPAVAASLVELLGTQKAQQWEEGIDRLRAVCKEHRVDRGIHGIIKNYQNALEAYGRFKASFEDLSEQRRLLGFAISVLQERATQYAKQRASSNQQVCAFIKESEDNAIDSAAKIARWAKRAGQGFDGAMIYLRNCRNKTSIRTADRLFNAARNLGNQAKARFTEAQKDHQQLSAILENVRTLTAERNQFDKALSTVKIRYKTFDSYSDTYDRSMQALMPSEKSCQAARKGMEKRLAEIQKQHPDYDASKQMVQILAAVGIGGPGVQLSVATMNQIRKDAYEKYKQQYPKFESSNKNLRDALKACHVSDTSRRHDPLTTGMRDAKLKIEKYLQDLDQWNERFEKSKNACIAALGLPPATDGKNVSGQAKVDKLYVVVEVRGFGNTPHWAGASYRMGGYDEVVIIANKPEGYKKKVKDYQKFLQGNPCEIINPPGFVWKKGRPMIWDKGNPKVTILSVEDDRKDIDDSVLANRWKFLGDDPRNLQQLKEAQGCAK